MVTNLAELCISNFSFIFIFTFSAIFNSELCGAILKEPNVNSPSLSKSVCTLPLVTSYFSILSPYSADDKANLTIILLAWLLIMMSSFTSDFIVTSLLSSDKTLLTQYGDELSSGQTFNKLFGLVSFIEPFCKLRFIFEVNKIELFGKGIGARTLALRLPG
ncbi:hypothetical protein [Vibrio sp. HDW18]|uniref:hypothetical protein n=1 Tax=Vibrio sp. HDW18 TaxID=2714948 RepID=UPI001F0E932D|nr:hypothetical protein [Vibrio sp. HDW18]